MTVTVADLQYNATQCAPGPTSGGVGTARVHARTRKATYSATTTMGIDNRKALPMLYAPRIQAGYMYIHISVYTYLYTYIRIFMYIYM